MNASPSRPSPEARRRWTSHLARGAAGLAAVAVVAAVVAACGGGDGHDAVAQGNDAVRELPRQVDLMQAA